MHKKSALSVGQIAQLRDQVTKILQKHIGSLSSLLAKQQPTPQPQNLYLWSQKQYAQLQTSLNNMGQFTFMLMQNYELVWDEVAHRQGIIAELRDSINQAATYIMELRQENDDMKGKLAQAETYIDWIEQQKQYLDAVYYDTRSSGSQLFPSRSESTLGWGQRQRKKNDNFQKIRDYISLLRKQHQQIEKEAVTYCKKYQVKLQECKKAKLFIEYLTEKLQKMQNKYQKDTVWEEPRNSRAQITTEEFLRMLQSTANISSNSFRQMLKGEDTNRLQNVLSYTLINESPSKCSLISDLNSTLFEHKPMKDQQVQTQRFKRVSISSQTDVETDKQANQDGQYDQYKIEVKIVNGPKSQLKQNREKQIAKILKDFHIDKAIEDRMKSKKGGARSTSIGKAVRRQPSQRKSVLVDTFQYYHKMLVLNRINKYRLNQPQNLNAPKSPKFK